jgi:hypothetical protein
MSEVSTIGLDLAKNVFQVHGANASGAVVFRKKLGRDRVLTMSPLRNSGTRTLDIGLEGDAIDRAIEHEGRDHAARGQASDEGRRFLVAVGDADPQAFAAAAAAVGPRHVGRSPGLVDEDQALGIEIELAFEPGLAPLQDVGAVLLGCVRSLLWNGPPLLPAS